MMELFDPAKPFFKGNLHCHSTLSDGLLTPEEVKAAYREMGYDFLAITDHRVMGEETHMEGCLLVLSGIEADFSLPGEVLHLIGVGMDGAFAREKLLRNPQACIRQIRRHGGRAIVAHPAWSLNTLGTLMALADGVTAAEIYNSVSACPWSPDRADSSYMLDVALTHGARYRFVASDDSHSYNGEAGVSCTMVQADDLTQDALFAALDEGRFYCSQGPRFEQITVKPGSVEVLCSPVCHVLFASNLVWTAGRCHSGTGLTMAQYKTNKDQGERYVRVQLVDAQGRKAWSNPIWL